MAADWIELINSADGDDLAAIDSKIAGLKSQADSIAKQVFALQAVKKMIEEKIGLRPHTRAHKKKPKLPPKPAPVLPTSVVGQYRREALAYLCREGVAKPSVVAEACKIPTASISATFDDCFWFERTPDGLKVTHEGRLAIR